MGVFSKGRVETEERTLPVLKGDIFDGYHVRKLMFVTGISTVNRFALFDWFAKFRDFTGGNSESHNRFLRGGLMAAMDDMIREAREIDGVNAVVDVSLQTQETMGGRFTTFLVTGMAATLSKIPEGETERELMKKILATLQERDGR